MLQILLTTQLKVHARTCSSTPVCCVAFLLSNSFYCYCRSRPSYCFNSFVNIFFTQLHFPFTLCYTKKFFFHFVLCFYFLFLRIFVLFLCYAPKCMLQIWRGFYMIQSFLRLLAFFVCRILKVARYNFISLNCCLKLNFIWIYERCSKILCETQAQLGNLKHECFLNGILHKFFDLKTMKNLVHFKWLLLPSCDNHKLN